MSNNPRVTATSPPFDGWMDTWMDAWMDARMDVSVDEWLDFKLLSTSGITDVDPMTQREY